MVPGLELRVSDSKNRTGTLAANAIDFSGAGELVLHSVRLGMLTDPPNGNHRFLTNTIDAATDYLQTIPAARITAAYYESCSWPTMRWCSRRSDHQTAAATTGTATATVASGLNGQPMALAPLAR